MTNATSLLYAEQVSKTFPLSAGGEQTVLETVSLTVVEGEVVALLGRSGSGKSTLLRILAGLIEPSQGKVLRSGVPLTGPNPDVAMVFQSFALLPWLTVRRTQNWAWSHAVLRGMHLRRKPSTPLGWWVWRVLKEPIRRSYLAECGSELVSPAHLS